MPKFFYIARNKEGRKESSVIESLSIEEATRLLQSRNLIVINIVPEQKEASGELSQEVASKVKLKSKHSRITNEDLVLFCRQLATLLGAGVTILRTLEIISQQVGSRRLYDVIKALKKDMEAGQSFHEAMKKHSTVFSEMWINLIESGEASGNLSLVLGRLAGYLERAATFKRKIISALIYPIILAVAGLGALLFLTIKIIPTFVDLFNQFNITLPLLTQIIVNISYFLRHYFIFILAACIAGFFLFKKYISTKPGKKNFEKILFNSPGFGDFFRSLVFERFTAEMATLVESGVPILYSLEITESSVGSVLIGEIIHNVKDSVREGKPLSVPLEQSGYFDPMAVQMVAIGEEIGELSNMFKRLNAFYQEYVDTFLARFTAMFEPIMLLFIGAVVGIMVIGMFLPIFEITKIK
ncbi:MAG: type II secretion system F family protein [Candidatus Omnitrophica bacterium]|nr:type II secretion system F family protein [Candidatus Omnitrophota bacterium]